MKRIKKIASLLLALVMVLAMALPAMADETGYKITINQNEKDKVIHQYGAYQIFAGDLATDDNGNKILSNIEWGKGIDPKTEVDGKDLLATLQSSNEFVYGEGENRKNLFDGCTTAAAVADVLGKDPFTSSTGTTTATYTEAFARAVNPFLTAANHTGDTNDGKAIINVGNEAGYYLIKDMGNVQPEGAYTRFMLQVVGNVEVTVKSEIPTGDKEVYTDASTATDANNASIGSHVSYRITGTVPNHVGYNYYYYIMNDTLSEGLTFDGNIKVTVGDTELIKDTDYYVYTGEAAGGSTFRLAFANIMNYAPGTKIVVTYSATVNDKAVIGVEGNPNKWTLQYSNNPNDTFDGTRPDGNPGLPKDETNEPLGETPEEITLTYVTELDITKYADEATEGHLLAGAEFTLTGTSKQVVLTDTDYYKEAEDGTYYALADGTYTTEAPTTEVTYRAIGTGSETTTEGYILKDGEYIIPQDRTEYNGETIYQRVEANADKYLDVNTKYTKTTATEVSYVDVDVSMKYTTGADGKIFFKGLGAGTYTLTETVTPDGYNRLDPITITIGFKAPESVADGTEKCTWTMTSDTLQITQNMDGEVGLGIFAADIINKSGATLPSTGGIGTTIFYVVGGILVVVAGILLVVKKRMQAE